MVPEKKKDLVAVGVILLYCVLYAVLRLLVSSTLELDEVEQFMDGTSFSWGYPREAPLYTWIVKIASSFFGMNIGTLMAVKFTLLFFFYFSFYLIVRSFYPTEESLIITGSLLLFQTYSYKFIRHLTHTILVTAMASITLLFYNYLILKRKTIYYFLFGISVGLGLLSKYNFIFFLSPLILASLSSRETRRAMFDKRTLLSIFICSFILIPHILWLIQENFLPIRDVLNRTNTGELKLHSLSSFSILVPLYSEALVFLSIFILFFRNFISLKASQENQLPSIFRWIAFYGIMIPLFVVFLFHVGRFSGKWLSPVFFTIPLALFSFVNLDKSRKRFKFFGYLCIFVAILVFTARALIGFYPDVTGKVERVHIPFKNIALELTREVKERGIGNLEDVSIISDSDYLAANLVAQMSGTKLILLQALKNPPKSNREKEMVIVWDLKKSGKKIPDEFIKAFPSAIPMQPIKAPYLHSKKFSFYVLGAAIVPRN